MNYRILSTRITAQGLVPLRTRARQVGELFGLDTMQRTRFITALSEIARNAVQYAGEGTVTFMLDSGGDEQPCQRLLAEVVDAGPGIDDLPAVLAGRLNASQQVPMGIAGCKRLTDSLTFETPEGGGTRAIIAMVLPRHAPHFEASDVTERVEQLARRKPQGPLEELEHQNREMLDALQQLRIKQVELERADERKNQFLAMLAHELRNPLGTLHMTLELMRRMKDISAEQVAKRQDVMSRQIEQITRLVDDLLDVSRVSRGKVELHLQVTDINMLAGEALEMTSAATSAKGHEVVFRPWQAKLPVQADVTRVKQVLCNLIHNAARYTPAHGKIELAVRREGAYAVVDVQDNGIGIPPDVLPHVFELFVQGDASSREDAKGGLGVGLTLARRLVEDHGGSVQASSAGLGAGSRFTVTLPMCAAGGADD